MYIQTYFKIVLRRRLIIIMTYLKYCTPDITSTMTSHVSYFNQAMRPSASNYDGPEYMSI